MSDNVVQLTRHPTALLIRRTLGTQNLLALQPLGRELELVAGRGAHRERAADGKRQRPAQHPEQRVVHRSSRSAGTSGE